MRHTRTDSNVRSRSLKSSTLIALAGALGLLLLAPPARALIVPPDEPVTCSDTPPGHTEFQCNPTRNECVPPAGVPIQGTIQRATEKFNVGNCSQCPVGSEKSEWLGGCTCHVTRIQALRDAGLNKDVRHGIMFANLTSMPPQNTDNLIVAFAGQNGISGGSVSGGGPGNLTGQPDGWDDHCDDSSCGVFAFNGDSLVGRLMRPDVLGSERTRVVVFPDNKYDWGRNATENAQISQGMADHIRSLVDLSVIRTIVITGHSRGGCLALSVARKLPADLDNVRIFVLPLDAVCDPGRPQEENFTAWQGVDNPRTDAWFWEGWQSTYATDASIGPNACVANVVGGQLFGPLLLHGLKINDSPAPAHQFNNWWSTMEHVPLGSEYSIEVIRQGVGSLYYFVKNNLPPCGPGNCAGCCTAQGICLGGTQPSVCGGGGLACTSCGNGQCVNHACVMPCGPGTCNGCCSNGVCLGGNSVNACGSGGNACFACPAPPANAYAVCSGGHCGFACKFGYHDCGDGKCIKANCP